MKELELYKKALDVGNKITDIKFDTVSDVNFEVDRGYSNDSVITTGRVIIDLYKEEYAIDIKEDEKTIDLVVEFDDEAFNHFLKDNVHQFLKIK